MKTRHYIILFLWLVAMIAINVYQGVLERDRQQQISERLDEAIRLTDDLNKRLQAINARLGGSAKESKQ